MASPKKNESVNLRMDAGTRDTILRGAAATGKSLTAFMTDAALVSAENVLLDRRFIAVDAAVFDGIDAMLAEPAKANTRLAQLLADNRDWID